MIHVTEPPLTAVIDEARCIGCTLCIAACPVDAIAGAAKLMHTVIAAECTGCALCVAPCPVDCIEMTEAPAAAPRGEREERARRRDAARRARLAREPAPRAARAGAGNRKRATIERVMKRAAQRLASRTATK